MSKQSHITHDTFELDKFVELFDIVMTSTNPAVQKCFRNLLLIASLTQSADRPTIGPLQSLVTKIDMLTVQVESLAAGRLQPSQSQYYNL